MRFLLSSLRYRLFSGKNYIYLLQIQEQKDNHIVCNYFTNKANIDKEIKANKENFGSKKITKFISEEKLHGGKLVYVGSLTRQLKSAKFISLSSSALGIMLMPFLVETLNTSGLFAKLFVLGTSSFFIFLTPMFSIILTKRYVSRIYYNNEENKIVLIMFNFFMIEYKVELTVNDLYVPEITGPFSTIKIKKNNQPLFIELNQIDDINLVEKISGFDKPFNINKYKDKK